MKYLSFFGLLVFVLTMESCTSDLVTESNSEVDFAHYTIDDLHSYTGSPAATYQVFTTGNLFNNKMFSSTSEVFIGGVGQGQSTVQHYFYTGNLLSSVVFDQDIRSFYYDGAQKLIGADRETSSSHIYYRYVEQPGNLVFCERLSLPYDNVDAVINARSILQFNADDEVIMAGSDSNLDGVMDNVNTFTYSNNNLMTLSYYNGNTEVYNYSTIVDNFSVLRDNSHGKKVARLMCCESFCGLSYDLKYSKNVLLQDSTQETYEVLSNNYYKKKTKVENSIDPDAQYTTTTEFFFN